MSNLNNFFFLLISVNCVKFVIIISEVSGKHLKKRSLADIKCHETGRFYRYFHTIFFPLRCYYMIQGLKNIFLHKIIIYMIFQK